MATTDSLIDTEAHTGPDGTSHAPDTALDSCTLCQAGITGGASALDYLVNLEHKRQRGPNRDLGLKILAAASGPMADHPDSLWMTLLALEAVDAEPCVSCGEAAR